MALLNTIRNVINELSDWLLYSRPTSDTERERAKRVLFLMNRLERLLHELTLDEVKLSTLPLRGQIQDLEGLSARISKTAKDMSTANDVATIAASAITIVAGVVGLLGG